MPGAPVRNWQARQDLNPRSTDLESVALANYATGLHQINNNFNIKFTTFQEVFYLNPIFIFLRHFSYYLTL